MSEWSEIYVEVPSESSEAVTAHLLEAGCQGVSEKGEAIRQLSGFLPPDRDIETIADDLTDRFARLPEFGLSAPLVFRVGTVDEKDWENEWKKYFKPLLIGRRLLVKPSWEYVEEGRDRLIVEIDPGQAFGTGGHPTTRLCLQALDDYVEPGMVVADIGTGSGILALAAARLGASVVYATDSDRLPRTISRNNVTLNGLHDVVTVYEMDEFNTVAQNCDLVVANIIASAIVELTPSFVARLKPGGILIASGIVEDRLPEVLDTFESSGLQLLESREDEIWRAPIARKP